ncbi:MAG: SOS response-associated peptidase family protein [Verrucomicrobiota bacterium]
MCNLYEVGPTPRGRRFEWESQIEEALGEITYVAPGRDGIVVRLTPDGMKAAAMRWGFSRPWSDCINNARDDKLDGRMWTDPFAHRRCVLPMRGFFEWSGPKGSKTKHRIVAEEEYWTWVAGIWEEAPGDETGFAYSMLTTGANAQMTEIHDRMPVILPAQAVEEFVGTTPEGARELVRAYGGELSILPPPAAKELEFDFG